MKNVFIHPTAEVSDKARIGEGTRIWNQAQVRENAVIGRNCIISKNVYVDFDVTIGNGVKVQNNVSLYHGLMIEDNVFIGPSAIFTNDRYPRAFNDDFEVGRTLIRKGASICANATIRCDVVVGEYATVGSGAVVTKDVKPYSLVIGVPARQVGWVCECGQVLGEGLVCHKCGKKYAEHGEFLFRE